MKDAASDEGAKADEAPVAVAENDAKTEEKESDVAEGLGADDAE